MNFKEYEKISAETRMYPDEFRIPYVVLGLVGEAGEFMEKIQNTTPAEEIAKELGDILWYCAMCRYELNIPVIEDWPVIEDSSVLSSPFILPVAIGEISEQAKKFIRDDWSAESTDFPEKRKETVSTALLKLLRLCQSFAKEFLNTDLETIARQNVEKLQKRYNEGKIHGEGDNR